MRDMIGFLRAHVHDQGGQRVHVVDAVATPRQLR